MTPARSDLSRYIEWDVANWSRAVDFWLACGAQEAIDGGRVLELGARDGGLSMWFADRGASFVLCSDLQGPSVAAREMHRQALSEGRIVHRALDATNLDFSEEFDVVAFKSVLGGIGGVGGPTALELTMQGAYRALRPGGLLLMAENLAASPMHAYMRRKYVPWSDRWRYLTVGELDSLMSGFSGWTRRLLGFSGAFGRTEKQRGVLGALDRAGTELIVPPSWRYIISGVGNKAAQTPHARHAADQDV